MRLISLKRTLSHLEVSWNKRITDDSVPTLCALSDLNFLSLKRTSISMKGVQKLACAVKVRGKKISIILPSECEEYMLSGFHVSAGFHPNSATSELIDCASWAGVVVRPAQGVRDEA